MIGYLERDSSNKIVAEHINIFYNLVTLCVILHNLPRGKQTKKKTTRKTHLEGRMQ